MENTEENCEMMGKVWKVSWIVKRFGKYRRKLQNDMENMEENSDKIWQYRRTASGIVIR